MIASFLIALHRRELIHCITRGQISSETLSSFFIFLRKKNQFSLKFQVKTCQFHKWKSAALLSLLRSSFFSSLGYNFPSRIGSSHVQVASSRSLLSRSRKPHLQTEEEEVKAALAGHTWPCPLLLGDRLCSGHQKKNEGHPRSSRSIHPEPGGTGGWDRAPGGRRTQTAFNLQSSPRLQSSFPNSENVVFLGNAGPVLKVGLETATEPVRADVPE